MSSIGARQPLLEPDVIALTHLQPPSPPKLALAEDLQQALEGDAGEDLRAERRKLIERVDFIPLEGLAKFDPRAHGSLTVLLGLGDAPKAETPRLEAMGFL